MFFEIILCKKLDIACVGLSIEEMIILKIWPIYYLMIYILF